jgi:hypothetical protein
MTKVEIIAGTIQDIKTTADADQFSNQCFNALRTKEINRKEYHDLFALGWPKLQEPSVLQFNELSSIRNRVDRKGDRGLAGFALGIYDNTIRERILIEAWRDRLVAAGKVSAIEIADHGMANDGMIHFSKTDINAKADFKIKVAGSKMTDIPDGDMLVEVKFCPSQKYLHFKQGDFSAYASDGTNVLIFIGNDRMVGANGNPNWDIDITDLNLEEWGLITTASVKDVLLNEVFKERRNARGDLMMGGKDCVRLNRDSTFPRITKYVFLYNW